MDLTKYTKCGGCAAKFSAGSLSEVLSKFEIKDKNILVGFNQSDDASVYKISDDLAIVQTLDFFPPMVDDPYIFGQIAAANAISDIYAMGAVPKTALNMLAIPKDMDKEIVYQILKGGNDKANEAGIAISGGHTIEDDVPKYGLSVTGFIDPSKIYKNSNAKAGDVVILTKPLGVGIINTAKKADLIDNFTYKKAIDLMTTLNKYALEIMTDFDIKCCTDVTGFGLLGHVLEIAKASHLTIKINSKNIPIIDRALGFAKDGIMSKAVYSNQDYIEDFTNKNNCTQEIFDIMTDPQTSGGLLIFVSKDQSEKLLEKLKRNKFTKYSEIIGFTEVKIGDYSIIIE